jgi:hypothetical protein
LISGQVSQNVVPCQTGVELVEEYQKLLGKCNRRKSDLLSAENLFSNLPHLILLQVRIPFPAALQPVGDVAALTELSWRVL